jgi:hypothetical protein
VGLALLVVLAAATAGTLHFSGPRWTPSLHVSAPTPGRPLVHPQASAPQAAPSHVTTHFPWLILAIVAAVVAALALALLLRLWWMRRLSGAEREQRAAAAVTEVRPAPVAQPPDVPVLRSGIEQALAALDEAREPADAVVRAWLGLQETAEASGILRQASETPTEFTSRILSGAVADDGAVRTLLRLYLRARFGDHPVTQDDVAAVRAALRELVATWPAPTPAGAAGAGR